MFVDDLTAVAAPTQFKEGLLHRQKHLQALRNLAGLTPPPDYTEEQ